MSRVFSPICRARSALRREAVGQFFPQVQRQESPLRRHAAGLSDALSIGRRPTPVAGCGPIYPIYGIYFIGRIRVFTVYFVYRDFVTVR